MKSKLCIAMAIVLCVAAYHVKAQNTFPSSGKVGIGTTSPNASSLLEVASTTKGILIPRMTQAQRNAIASPATGLMIYQTDSNPGFFYYTGANWIGLAPKNKTWNITGNSGLDSTANFIGTQDNGAFSIRTNNTERMHVGSTGNIGIGTTAPQAMLDINGDAHINGLTVGRGISSGNYITNAVLGYQALQSNSGGNRVTAVGYQALYSNYNGTNNTAIGSTALYSNTGGVGNVAVGDFALYDNVTGSSNTAIGSNALFYNTGGNNTAVGDGALRQNTTGNYNSALGTGALLNNTTGAENVANGYLTLSNNSTGGQNTATGYNALIDNTTGIGNTASGAYALLSSTTSFDNTASGDATLYSNTTGGYNTAFGASALFGNTTGSYNTAIGYNAGVPSQSTISYTTAIGANAVVTRSNSMVLGGTGNYAVNVGIGTTNPQYTLSVNGTIQAKEVRVETGWSDFVFDKNYKLRPLSEVEKYISQNHHLPEIPSAAEIQKNGLAVADVQTKMMQKIEELTLYLIESQKQIIESQKQIIQLQKEIDQLKSNNNEHK